MVFSNQMERNPSGLAVWTDAYWDVDRACPAGLGSFTVKSLRLNLVGTMSDPPSHSEGICLTGLGCEVYWEITGAPTDDNC